MQESVVIFMRFYAPNNFSGCTTSAFFCEIKEGFIPLTILLGVQPTSAFFEIIFVLYS